MASKKKTEKKEEKETVERITRAAAPTIRNLYEDGYRDCARKVKEDLAKIFFNRSRAILPGPWQAWLDGVISGDPAPELADPDPSGNARVEGEDVA